MLSNKYLAPTYTIRPLLSNRLCGERGKRTEAGMGDKSCEVWTTNDPQTVCLPTKSEKLSTLHTRQISKGSTQTETIKENCVRRHFLRGRNLSDCFCNHQLVQRSRHRALNSLWRISLHPVQYFTCMQHFSCIYYIINTKSTEVKMSLSRKELCIRKWVKNSPLN